MALARVLLLLSGLAALIVCGFTQSTTVGSSSTPSSTPSTTPSTTPLTTTDTTTRTFGRATTTSTMRPFRTTTRPFNRFGRTTTTISTITEPTTVTTSTATTSTTGKTTVSSLATTADPGLGKTVTETTTAIPSTTTKSSGATTSTGTGIPKVRDQTNQTYTKLSFTIGNVSQLLSGNLADLKSFIATELQALNNVKLASADLKMLQNAMNSISGAITSLFGSADTRVQRSLVDLGRHLNSSINSIVVLEQSNLGKYKLSSDAKTVAKSLKQLETTFYNNLTTCLNTFNGSVLSDALTIENTLHTIANGVLMPAPDLQAAGCPTSKDCTALLRSIPSSIESWRPTVTTAINQLPNVNDFRACVTTQVNFARNGLNDITNTAPPPVDFRAVLSNQTDQLQKNVSIAVGNFSASYQTLISPVANQINLVRIFVSKNSQYDPKSIMKTHFVPVASTDEAVISSITAILPKITALHRQVIVPLLNLEQTVSAKISQAIVKNSTSAAANCDTAVQAIITAKTTFNASIATCFANTGTALETILAGAKTSINITMVANFSSAIQAASSVICATVCPDATLQQVATQLKSKLDAGVQLLTDLKKRATDQVTQVYTTIQGCIGDAIREATSAIDDRTSVPVKACLATN